ncbi:MAG: DISARM system phospholipase D-like protein DrmC [Proteobacteria bacterium]|nr:DISARM system phospholipase D-like protein DrmC [Pseudomonadota bacterium]
MEGLTTAAAALCHVLHKNRIEMLCEKLRGPQIGSIADWETCLSAKGDGKSELHKLYEFAAANGVETAVLRGILMGASQATQYTRSLEQIELIWTGPSTRLVPTRRTEQALLELIKAAEESLFLTSFVAYKVDSLIDALWKATTRGVRVSILLEESQLEGGALTFDSIALLRAELSTAHFYTWEPQEGEFLGGKVHAKVAVCDRSMCFISSANLTGHAMEKNMEAGVLIRGGGVAAQLQDHLEGLVDTGVIGRYE